MCFQVDELYEAFCIQSRLREGASRMKQAFSSSPSTKGTKESIAEVNRRYKEYTEVLAKSIISSVLGIQVKLFAWKHEHRVRWIMEFVGKQSNLRWQVALRKEE